MSSTSEINNQDTQEEEITQPENKVVWEALLAYIPIFCLYPWSLRKQRPELAEHAQQGMILFLTELLLFLIYIPFLYRLLWLGIAVMAILGLVSVFTGKPYRLPVLADLIEKIRD